MEWLAVKLDNSHPNHISKPPRVSLTMIFWGSLYDIIGGPHYTFLYLFFVLNFLFSLFLPEIFTPNQSHSFRFLKHQIIGTYFTLHGHFGQVDLLFLNIQQALEGGIWCGKIFSYPPKNGHGAKNCPLLFSGDLELHQKETTLFCYHVTNQTWLMLHTQKIKLGNLKQTH